MPLACKNLSAKVSAAAGESRERCTLAVDGVRSGARTSRVCSRVRGTRRGVGAIRSRGCPNERRVGVGCGGSEAKMGVREALQVFVRRMAFGARHASRTKAGGRESERQRERPRVAEEKQRDRRPEREVGFGKPSDPFREAGAPACRGVHLSSDSGCGSRRMGHETISRLCSPPRTSLSSVAVKPKPGPIQVYATSR
jgi:hypothetical protein